MGRFLSVLPVAVAHAEVMAEVAPAQIGTQDETILVHFVGVVGYKAHPSSEGVLSDHISFNELRLDHHALLFALGRCRWRALKF